MVSLLHRWAQVFSRRPRPPQPAADRPNAQLAHELMLELEDGQPSPLLLKLATGFPSALLCVLAAGVLAGALAGQHVGQPLRAWELQAVAQAAGPARPASAGPATRAPAVPVADAAVKPAPGAPGPMGPALLADNRAH